MHACCSTPRCSCCSSCRWSSGFSPSQGGALGLALGRDGAVRPEPARWLRNGGVTLNLAQVFLDVRLDHHEPDRGLPWQDGSGWMLATAVLLACSIAYLSRETDVLYFQF